jgi:hypothetical protein
LSDHPEASLGLISALGRRDETSIGIFPWAGLNSYHPAFQRGRHAATRISRWLAGAAAAWPVVASAQQVGRSYRLGFLIPAPRKSAAVSAFFDELRASGFIEGQNLGGQL